MPAEAADVRSGDAQPVKRPAQAAHRQAGQNTVEFAIVSGVLFLLVLGILDFGYLFASRIAATNAARTAARYAATHPTAWTNSTTPASNTIEGQLQLVAVPAVIANDDSHVTISYLLPGSGSATTCGQWSAAANAFVPVNGYTQGTCVVTGSLIQVQATYVYTWITPFLSSYFQAVSITVLAVELEEQ